MQFHIENMMCGGCARGVTEAVRSVDPNAGVTADTATGKVEIASVLPPAIFESALKEAGYPPAPAA